jgi:hypothetical protein
MSNHTVEAIRSATIRVLAGESNGIRHPNPRELQFLLSGVAELLQREDEREAPPRLQSYVSISKPLPELSPDDKCKVMDMFWQLVVDRVITPRNDESPGKFQLTLDGPSKLKSMAE